jgi:pyruvate/2-oxoglutarate dehydrogenase complex dihydrolipoamide acyltransferase (E2) component
LFEFKLPDLGEGIAEGEILKWHVTEGGDVVEDAPLVDVETDKAAVTIPSPRGGRIASLRGKVGDTVNVGDVVVVIDDGAGAKAAPAAAACTRRSPWWPHLPRPQLRRRKWVAQWAARLHPLPRLQPPVRAARCPRRPPRGAWPAS